MEKIISLFQRNYEGDRLVRNEVVPGAEWVILGEGVATEKWDGTCCMVKDGLLYKRYDAKNGKQPPPGFIAAQDPDPQTGHWPGWLLVNPNNPADRWHTEAFEQLASLADGTYELVGPKINANMYKLSAHELWRHGTRIITPPRTFEELRDWFAHTNIEGIVWHHPDGRRVKIKKKDFGLKW
ncbi:MAG TPA: DUF5565 family protein [Chitinophagaceae bacterium]|nr:DUF5565 family protein [Chitinophagaceae bacterium]